MTKDSHSSLAAGLPSPAQEGNAQMLFDKVARHLLKQSARSGTRSECRYRDGKLRCAVGCLILNKYYGAGLEGWTIYARPVRQAVEFSLRRPLTDDDIRLLSRLQDVHDSIDPEKWPERLAKIADDRQLSKTALVSPPTGNGPSAARDEP